MDEKLKKHGSISWSELMTNDVAGAKEFYGKLFGWEYEDMPMEEGMTYTVLKANGDEVGGMMKIPADAPPMPPCWGLYITVDNVDETVEKSGSIGATLILPPRDIAEVGRFAVIQDPQGAFISIISYAE